MANARRAQASQAREVARSAPDVGVVAEVARVLAHLPRGTSVHHELHDAAGAVRLALGLAVVPRPEGGR